MGWRRLRNAMVSWWKRLFYSLAGFVGAGVVCVAYAALEKVMEAPKGREGGDALLMTVGFVLSFSVLGWIVSAPLVLMVGDVRGGRFWLYWILGSGFGPLLMMAVFALVYYLVPGDPNAKWFRPELRPLVYLAGAMSCTAALIYLSALRRAQTKAGGRA
jgi:hypothetical protein